MSTDNQQTVEGTSGTGKTSSLTNEIKDKKQPDQLTVLVFKDNYSSRTFQISLKWITRLGFTLAAAGAAVVVLGIFSVHSYWAAQRGNPAKVAELERELSDSKASYQSLEAKMNAISTPAPLASPVQAAPTSLPPADPQQQITPADGVYFIPSLKVSPNRNPSEIPIQVNRPTVTWNGRNLTVHFTIQYIRNDGGNQQGRIMILARGPETLLAYPNGVFGKANFTGTIDQKQGEYFSVSRFREVNAVFGSLQSPRQLEQIEIFLLDQDGSVLLRERISPSGGTVQGATGKTTN